MCGCSGSMGKWQPVKRIVGRREKLRRCGKKCFLDPNPQKPRYPVCKPTSCKPSCEGALAARRRAVTQSDFGMERKAIMLGKRLGCTWATGATAKRGRGKAAKGK